MSIEIRTIDENELSRYLNVLGSAFGEPIPEDEVVRFAEVLPLERAFAAFDSGAMVGTGGAFPFHMTVPGGAVVPAAGVTMVGVLPSHRRRGVMSSIMRKLIDQAKERSEPVAILWASEESIYQRFGYGFASNQGHISIEKHRANFLGRPEPVGTVRLVTLEEAPSVLAPIYDQVLKTRPGMLARSETWWRNHTLIDIERHREGESPKFCAVLRLDGRDQAYAIYRTGGGWGADVTPNGWVNVREVAAVDPVAYREIWRFLFGIDLMDRIKAWYLPADLPLTLMLEEPRRLRFAKSDSLWLRIVDLAAALSARTYAADGSISFAVRDDYCPWNEGEWTLIVEEGRGRLERGGEPDLSTDAAGLASVYLGAFTFGELQRALRLEECTPGAVKRADAMFRTDVAPWCVENF